MSINYFSNCKSSSSSKEFGICDNAAPATTPAFLNEDFPSSWIGIVNNTNEIEITFNAIDNCIEILREDGKMDKRCDGLLSYGNNLIFVELKEREGGQWIKTGRNQLTATINRFKQEHDISTFDSIKASICNSLRPQFNSGHFENIQKFKDDTGYILSTKQRIDI